MKSPLFFPLLVMILLLSPVVVLGQASLRGVVTDTLTNEKLVGVNVVLVGTGMGNATNIEGEYTITGIPQRVYTVRVSCIGYEVKMIEVDFSKTATRRLDVKLNSTVIQGQEVVVTAQMRGQVAAINRQVSSNTIMNVVSEEKIKELPDANAAEAIGRLPGVSILRSGGEAAGIVLRGLSSKFSNITVDGVKIPPTDPNTRDVDLSTLSQGSLAGIELHKTLTPDQDADAIAGGVNLVTKKAPSERLVQLDLKGDYNYLMKSPKQYDVSIRYGERFFNEVLGVQLQGNAESKIRSREFTSYGYGTLDNQTLPTWGTYDPSAYDNDYNINQFTVRFTDEIRKRNGGQAILDVNTPDDGLVKLTGVYSETGSNIKTYERRYPAGSGGYDYNYQATEQKTGTMNGSLQGKNYLLGLTIDWNAAYAQSKTQNPFGYRLAFQEPSGGTYLLSKDHPELNIIAMANNNFPTAVLDSTDYFRRENFDKEQTLQFNVSKKMTFWDIFTNDLKVGGKYKAKTRWMNTGDYVWNNYKVYPLKNGDGSTIDLSGTRFEGVTNSAVSLTRFIDPPVATRDLFGLYRMTPLISMDALRKWWDLNKNGVAAVAQDYGPNGLSVLSDYDVTERVSSAYLMNTLDVGQFATLIFGVRVETESNDYRGKYSDASVGGTGAVVTLNGKVIDTTAHYSETIWLPSAQLALKPTNFLSVRFAAYRALGRPDFNLRLPQFAPGSGTTVFVAGNPNLRDAKAWNFEVNTQIYDNTIGLFAVSGFYKVIDDLYHQTNNLNLSWPSGGPDRLIGYKGWTTNAKAGYYHRLDGLLDYLNMSSWKQNPVFVNLTHNSPTYTLNLAYNSPNPSYAWGFELEHQMGFGFLPVTWLKNITLSYNLSITRSETNIIVGKSVTDTVYIPASGTPGTPRYRPDTTALLSDGIAVLETRQSEDQPELYGNVALGYDIGGFSARISVFYQSRYTRQYSANGTSDVIVNAFAKWDLAFKQQISSTISLFLNVNNFTSRQETTSRLNKIFDWGYLPRTAELYGATVDFGVRLSL